MLIALISIIDYLVQIIVICVIGQFVLSLLIAFNVVNMSNQIVRSIYMALNAILDPLLRPIRKIMPDTGMIDLSPIVLIVGLQVLQMVLAGMA